MQRICVMLIISLIINAAAAQSISISGKVVNKNNQPIANAVVTLAGQKINDTTDGKGAFSLSQITFVGNPGQKQLSVERIYITNGSIRLSLVQESRVTIEMFDMMGNLLAKTPNRVAAAGDYRFDIAREPLATNMKLVRVSTGRRTSTFRYFPIDKGKHSVSSALPVPSTTSNRLAKTAATIDTLKISAAGYMSKDTAISSYEAIVNVTLDTMSLGKFSFFVTSLEGLQRLSGSQNGFGGDFRFGKTGQGAGLLGADSICQCLAEYSMPGSKIKKWRAFLSVSKGPDGTQVNAIDRIGKGPWYDRMGRLVSNTVSDLLQSRPNGDAAIKNDLPNEYGVPNHQPDPNQPAVDNHMTITGSGADGKLYSAITDCTCNEWTSTTADIKPRVGLSWPRGGGGRGGGGMGGMQSWVSQMNASGCEAGIDLDERTGAGERGVYTIGNGGGYGGFYCFALNP